MIQSPTVRTVLYYYTLLHVVMTSHELLTSLFLLLLLLLALCTLCLSLSAVL